MPELENPLLTDNTTHDQGQAKPLNQGLWFCKQWSPALFAAINNLQISETQSLITQGALVNGTDPNQRTPLIAAIDIYEYTISGFIQNKLVRQDLPQYSYTLRNPNLVAPLETDILKIVDILIAAKADLTATCVDSIAYSDEHYFMNALHYAARNGFTEVVLKLLQNGMDVNSIARHEDDTQHCLQCCTPLIHKGKTALYFAAKYGHPATCAALLAHGANINAFSADHTTPLHEAAFEGHNEVVALLLAHGASVALANPLLVAIIRRHTKCAELLLDCGVASLQTVNIHFLTPLIIGAINTNQQSIAEKIITKAQHVDPEVLKCVIDNNATALLTIIVNQQLVVETRTFKPLAYAQSHNKPACVAILATSGQIRMQRHSLRI